MIKLQQVLGYQFSQPEILAQALTHRSYAHEADGPDDQHNERLELLGDAVLGLVIVSILLERFPEASEGRISKIRSWLVSEKSLAEIATNKLDLGGRIRMGRGELRSGGLSKPRLLASTLEAVLGAIFIDGGFSSADAVIRTCFGEVVHDLDETAGYHQDFKSDLQEQTQKKFKLAPVYRLVAETGPSHNRHFRVEVLVGEQKYGEGEGRSKKSAEQEAARAALASIGSNDEGAVISIGKDEEDEC